MVLMRVRNDNAEQRIIGGGKSADWMQRKLIDVGRIEREADVQYQPLALRLELDTRATDFACPTVDTDAHRINL